MADEDISVRVPLSRVVGWRYQGIDGWGDVWRVCDRVPPTFEDPSQWRVQALGVIGDVVPSALSSQMQNNEAS